MKIQIKTQYEPLDIEIDDVVIHARIDLSIKNRARIAKICRKLASECARIAKESAAAEESEDLDKAIELRDRLTRSIAPAVVTIIGQESYDEIVAACGGDVTYGACIEVMLPIIQATNEALDKINNKSAAHDLGKVPISDALLPLNLA